MKKATKPAGKKPAAKNPAAKKSPLRPKQKAEGQAELLPILERLAQSAERLAQAAEQMALATARISAAAGSQQGLETQGETPGEVVGVMVIDESEE
jgi:hypothetical protein